MIFAQTPPIPGVETWKDFPVIAVIVLCFLLAGGGIFFFTRWIWNEYKKERDKDLAWRAEQNLAREAAVAEQNRLWREALEDRDERYELFDQQRSVAIQGLAEMMAKMIGMLGDHDAQAKDILANTKTIIDNTRPVKQRVQR